MSSDFSEDPLNSNNVEWTDADDLNLDATDLCTFTDQFDAGAVIDSNSNVFHDCHSSFALCDNGDLECGNV